MLSEENGARVRAGQSVVVAYPKGLTTLCQTHGAIHAAATALAEYRPPLLDLTVNHRTQHTNESRIDAAG